MKHRSGTCCKSFTWNTVRFSFKHIVSGVVVLIRVHERHTVTSTHRIHQYSSDLKIPNTRLLEHIGIYTVGHKKEQAYFYL